MVNHTYLQHFLKLVTFFLGTSNSQSFENCSNDGDYVVTDDCVNDLPYCLPPIFSTTNLPISQHLQILFNEIVFQCSGNITQLQTWYQVHGSDIEDPLIFQIWHPVNNTYYKLLSEVTIPSAVDNELVTVNNLSMPFFTGSFVGAFIKSPGKDYEFINIMIRNVENIPNGFVVLGNKLCEFDVISQGIAKLQAYSPEIVLTYEIDDNIYYTTDINTSVTCITPDVEDAMEETRSYLAVIVSVTVGAAALVAVITLTVILIVIYKRREKMVHLPVVLNRMSNNPNYDKTLSGKRSEELSRDHGKSITYILKDVHNPVIDKFESQLVDFMIDRSSLRPQQLIADGSFGKVYKGTYKKDDEVIHVAIKILKDTSSFQAEDFLKECLLAVRFDHPNVLRLIGVSILKEEGIPLMVMPYMQNGDVKSFVKSKRGGELDVTKFPEGLTYNLLIQMCLDIAKGMEYLSSSSCVHRDLAARNCVLDENMVTKVSDFGLTRDVYVNDYYKLHHSALLPVKWLAPEALLDRVFTVKSDVWSFGVTCWEIHTLGLQPYPTVDSHEMAKYLMSGERLDKPVLASNKMYEIMSCCWKLAPEKRPTFSHLVDELDQELQQCCNSNL